VRVGGVRMAQVGRQNGQTTFDVVARPVPADQVTSIANDPKFLRQVIRTLKGTTMLERLIEDLRRTRLARINPSAASHGLPAACAPGPVCRLARMPSPRCSQRFKNQIGLAVLVSFANRLRRSTLRRLR
jgi:hypothetical protein